MIVGIGTDIVQVSRLSKYIKRWGNKGLNRLFTSQELYDCNQRYQRDQSLAARFAAKEATYKALSSVQQVHLPRSFQHIEIKLNAAHKPYVVIAKHPEHLNLHVSLSHDGDYACAFVIAEQAR